MPRAHSRTLFKDCTASITTSVKAELEVVQFNIEQWETKIAKREEEIAAMQKVLEEEWKPTLAAEKVRIIIFFAKVA